jgi:hypothetical protein
MLGGSLESHEFIYRNAIHLKRRGLLKKMVFAGMGCVETGNDAEV